MLGAVEIQHCLISFALMCNQELVSLQTTSDSFTLSWVSRGEICGTSTSSVSYPPKGTYPFVHKQSHSVHPLVPVGAFPNVDLHPNDVPAPYTPWIGKGKGVKQKRTCGGEEVLRYSISDPPLFSILPHLFPSFPIHSVRREEELQWSH